MLDWIKKINKEYPEFWKNYLKTFETKSNRYVVLNTDCSGFDTKKDVIYSIGAVAVMDNSVKIGDNFEVVILQYKYLHDNGLSNDFIVKSYYTKLSEYEAVIKFLEYIKNSTLIGYRIHQEIEMINEVLEKLECGRMKNEALDIEIMHKKMMNSMNKSFSLDDIKKHYKIPLDENKLTSDNALDIALMFIKLKSYLKF